MREGTLLTDHVWTVHGQNAVQVGNLLGGDKIIKPGQVFSRIHVEDIAQALELSLQRPDPGAVYNLCDDDPAPPQDVIAHAAELLGLPVPPAIPFDQADMTPMARSFYAESKKVRNDRIKQALGWAPQFPTYRAGLAALLAQDS